MKIFGPLRFSGREVTTVETSRVLAPTSPQNASSVVFLFSAYPLAVPSRRLLPPPPALPTPIVSPLRSSSFPPRPHRLTAFLLVPITPLIYSARYTRDDPQFHAPSPPRTDRRHASSWRRSRERTLFTPAPRRRPPVFPVRNPSDRCNSRSFHARSCGPRCETHSNNRR